MGEVTEEDRDTEQRYRERSRMDVMMGKIHDVLTISTVKADMTVGPG